MGFEPMNAAVKGQCVKPLHQLAKKNGAGDGGRTRNSLLGRQELCQLSYSRMVEDTGFEPVTFCLQGRRSSHLN